MKITKPFSQFRNVLQLVVGASAYRFLCVLMAALLFCGMNSQVMAAALPAGASNDANNNAPASGDKFNSQSFLKASNLNADDHQHWTWGEEIGAAVLGTALVGGLVWGGYKYHQGRPERLEETQKQNEIKRSRSASFDGSVEDGNIEQRVNSMSTAKDSTIANMTGVNNEGVESSNGAGASTDSAWRAKLAACGQGVWDVMTLKPCWPASEAKSAPEKPLLDHLTEVRTAQLKKVLAEKKAKQPLKTTVYNLFALKSDVLPDEQTAWQKKAQEMERLAKLPASQATLGQHHDFYQHKTAEAGRKAAIDELNPTSSLDEILAVLDPEMSKEIQEPLKKYADNNNEMARAFAYFVAKNQDGWHSGHLLALRTAFDNARTDNVSQEIVRKMYKAIRERWTKDGGPNISRQNSMDNLNEIAEGNDDAEL